MEYEKDKDAEKRPGILDLLIDQYQESADGDSYLSKVLFHQLYKELRILDPDTADRIITLVCALCGDYQKGAYVAGVKTGIQMCHELGL
jgi:hypothetical protein